MGHLVEIPPKFLADVFIETGTNCGTTCKEQRRWRVPPWKKMHTIEVDSRNYEQFSPELTQMGVTCHLGNSPDVLKKIINPGETTTFFLDAHYSGEPEGPKGMWECPLLDELKAIKSFQWKSLPGIIIDDAHLFIEGREQYSPPFNLKQWPTLEEIKNVMTDYTWEVKDIGAGLMIWGLPT